MKLNYSLLFTLVYFSVSCQERKENEVLGYSVDTVHIDSKGRLFDLNGWMLTSDLNAEGTIFYLFNGHDLSIDEISLKSQEFVKSISLEPEGSNGVGEFIFNLQVLNDSVFFTKSMFLSTLIDYNGNVLKKVVWNDPNYFYETKLESFPRKSEVVSYKDGLIAFSLTYDFNNTKVYLDILSETDGTIRRFDVDPENSYRDFFFRFDDKLNFLEPGVELALENHQILVSHEFSNEILVFNLQGELEKLIHFDPKLTAKRAEIPEGSEFKSRDQIGKEYQQILEQARFEPLVWDNLNKRYFRMSSKRIFKDTYENGGGR